MANWDDLPPEAGAEWDALYSAEEWVPVLKREREPNPRDNGDGTMTWFNAPDSTGGEWLAVCSEHHYSSERCLCLRWERVEQKWTRLVTVRPCIRCKCAHPVPQEKCATVARALGFVSTAETLEWQDKEWPNADPRSNAVQMSLYSARMADEARASIDPASAAGPALAVLAELAGLAPDDEEDYDGYDE